MFSWPGTPTPRKRVCWAGCNFCTGVCELSTNRLSLGGGEKKRKVYVYPPPLGFGILYRGKKETRYTALFYANVIILLTLQGVPGILQEGANIVNIL